MQRASFMNFGGFATPCSPSLKTCLWPCRQQFTIPPNPIMNLATCNLPIPISNTLKLVEQIWHRQEMQCVCFNSAMMSVYVKRCQSQGCSGATSFMKVFVHYSVATFHVDLSKLQLRKNMQKHAQYWFPSISFHDIYNSSVGRAHGNLMRSF